MIKVLTYKNDTKVKQKPLEHLTQILHICGLG